MEQKSSGIGSDVGDYVVPSSSSQDHSLMRHSSDASTGSHEEYKCSQCHTLRQKIDSLKKQDEVYQTLKQKIVKTDTLIKKYVSKRQECEELQKKNEDLAHKYSLLMKNYKALENQLGNTVKELLPWKLDKDRYVGEVAELRNKLEKTEISLSASEVHCKQLKEMIVSNEAQEDEYKCTIAKLKGDVQEAVQRYKAESVKLKRATKHSMTLKRKAAEKEKREGRLLRVLRKMQKIMLDKGLVPPEIPDNICDQDGIVQGDDSDIELMDESEDEDQPIARLAEAGKSVPSETVINIYEHDEKEDEEYPTARKAEAEKSASPETVKNIHDHGESEDEKHSAEADKSGLSETVINIHEEGDNQSVSGESDCVKEEAFSDFADEIDAQLGNDETSDKGTPVKVASAGKHAQQQKPNENTLEDSISVMGRKGRRKGSCKSGADVEKVKTEEENKVVTMDTALILNCLGNSECLSDGDEDNKEEEELCQQDENITAGVKGKDVIRSRRRRSKRRDKRIKKEKEFSDGDGEIFESQEKSSSTPLDKSSLYGKIGVLSSSLSESSSDEDIEELKETGREKGETEKMEGRDKDETKKMTVAEDSITEEKLNQSERGDKANNVIMDESAENEKVALPEVGMCCSEEEQYEAGLKNKKEVDQNIEKEVNLKDKLTGKEDVRISDEVECKTKDTPEEQMGNKCSLVQTDEKVTENKILDGKSVIPRNDNKEKRQQHSEKDDILLQSPRRVTRGMLKSLQDTKVLKDTNGNHLKQDIRAKETRPRDEAVELASSSMLGHLDDVMIDLYEKNENMKGKMKSGLQGVGASKESISGKVLKEEENSEASLFDIEDVGNENISEEMNNISETKVEQIVNQAGERTKMSGDEKELVPDRKDAPSEVKESDEVPNEKQNQTEVTLYDRKLATDSSKSSEDVDRVQSDDQSVLEGGGSNNGLRMTRSKMKSVFVKKEFSGKRVTRLKAKMIPAVAEYLQGGDDKHSGKNLKQRGIRRNKSKEKSSSKSLEFLSTSESENDESERKSKVEGSPKKNLSKRNGNEKDRDTDTSVSGKGEKDKSLVCEIIKDEEISTSLFEKVNGGKRQLGDKCVKPKRNVSFLEEKKSSPSEQVSDSDVFVKEEVLSCEDAENFSKNDIDEKTQSAVKPRDGKDVKRKIGKKRKFEMKIIHNIKSEPSYKKKIVPNSGDALKEKKKKTKGIKSKRKKSETKDEELKTFRRVAFESDNENGEEKRKKMSAVTSPKSDGGHSKNCGTSKIGSFKEVIHEAERYRSGSELSDSLSSPKSAGFSPSRETPFGFEKPKVVLQTSKKLSNEGKPESKLKVADKKVEDNESNAKDKGGVNDLMRTSGSKRSSNIGVLCKSSLQKGKGSSQRVQGEPSHSQIQTVRENVEQFNYSLEVKDRSGNFPSELPFENLMNLDRVSPIPVSPHEMTEEPSLEPMIASILESLPLITRMLSPIPGSPLRDDVVGNRDNTEEQEHQQILSPLSPSDPVSFLPPFTTTDTSRPLSPLPLTPVPVEDTPEVVFDEPCGQKWTEKRESSIALPMNFHAVAPSGVIAVKPQVGTSFDSVRNMLHSNNDDASPALMPRPDNKTEAKRKDVEIQSKDVSLTKKNGDEDSSSASVKEEKEVVLPMKEVCDQTKRIEGGNMEVIEGDSLDVSGKLDDKCGLQMDDVPSMTDEWNKETSEDGVSQGEMYTTSSHLDDGQLKQLKSGGKQSLRSDSDVDSAEATEMFGDEDDSNVKREGNKRGKNEITDDVYRDGHIAGKTEKDTFGNTNEEVTQSVEGKDVIHAPVHDGGSTKKDDTLASSSVGGEDRGGRWQSSSSKQGTIKDIYREDNEVNKGKSLSGKSKISDEPENKSTDNAIESEKSSSSGLKREGSLGFTCTKDTSQSESLDGAPSKSSSNVSLNRSDEMEVTPEKHQEINKFGGFVSPKTEEENLKPNTANKQKGGTKNKAKTLSTKLELETEESDLSDFVDYNINTRERSKVDSSIAPASKMKVAQIWGNIAEKSLAEDKEEDVIHKRKNWREHSQLKKQKISTGSRLMSDSESVSSQDIVLDDLIQEIIEAVTMEDQNIVIQRIVQFLKKNSLDLLATVIGKVQRRDSSSDPVITSYEEKLVEVISQRDKKMKHSDKLVPPLLMCLSTLILGDKRKDKDALKGHTEKVTYCRMYAAFCRLQDDAMKLRVLCYDIVKKKILKWEELLVCISSVWSTALIKLQNQSLQPMVSVLEFLTWQRLKSSENKQTLSDALWQALEFFCQWSEPPVIEDDKMIQIFTDNMKDCELIKFENQSMTYAALEHPSFEIVKAIELLAWSKGWQWTWTVVIQSYIWPTMGGLCKELSLGQTQKASSLCCCLKVLGNSGNVGLKAEQNQYVFDLLKMVAEILTQSNEIIPPIVQVYAVQTILNLAPIQPFFANECLQKWKQDHKDIPLLRSDRFRLDNLANFVKSYKKPKNQGTQKSKNQGNQATQRSKNKGNQISYNSMPPPQDFSSQKRGGHRRLPKRPNFSS